MSTSPTERRRFSRVDFNAEVKLKQGEDTHSAQLIDISLNGVLLKTPEDYHIRADIPATIHIQLADDTAINMQVMLVHSSSELLGFHCESIDMESIIHLRRIIELNINDAEAAERVLAELMAGHA